MFEETILERTAKDEHLVLVDFCDESFVPPIGLGLIGVILSREYRTMVVQTLDFVGSIVKSGSKILAEAMSRLPDCIAAMSEKISDVIRGGEEMWGRLPEGVVVSEIFRRLPARDVARGRCVCRSWNSVLTSPEFRRLWYDGPCTDIEPWMGNCEPLPPELKWAAVTHRHCPVPPWLRWLYDEAHRHSARNAKLHIEVNVDDVDSDIEMPSIPLTETLELASSHGLICRLWQEEGRILVGNHRTRKWKLLPPFPAAARNTSTFKTWAHEAYSVRFVRHDLRQQTYVLFCLEIRPESYEVFTGCQNQQVFTHLYDSRACSWQAISRHPMSRDRFRRGISDGSVVVVGYNHVQRSVEESRVEEVGIMAYDFSNNSWDEVTTTLHSQDDSSSHSTTAEVVVEKAGICFRHRLDGMSGYRISSVFLCSNNAKDQYCRLVVVDGRRSDVISMCLWQLELDKESCCTVLEFRLVSTVQLLPQRPCLDVKDRYDGDAYSRSVGDDYMVMSTWIIRSDATLFMAIVLYGPWSWLVIYDVGRSSWLTAHAYGDVSSLDCGITCCCMWPLLEYDVRWHHDDHEVHKDDDVESPLMPVVLQCPRLLLRPRTRGALAAGAPLIGLQPISRPRLHLVRVPDIWSTP